MSFQAIIDHAFKVDLDTQVGPSRWYIISITTDTECFFEVEAVECEVHGILYTPHPTPHYRIAFCSQSNNQHGRNAPTCMLMKILISYLHGSIASRTVGLLT